MLKNICKDIVFIINHQIFNIKKEVGAGCSNLEKISKRNRNPKMNAANIDFIVDISKLFGLKIRFLTLCTLTSQIN